MLYNALVRIPESAYQAVTNVEAVHMERWGLGAADWCENCFFMQASNRPYGSAATAGRTKDRLRDCRGS
jgi:hypothetical protein